MICDDIKSFFNLSEKPAFDDKSEHIERIYDHVMSRRHVIDVSSIAHSESFDESEC